MSLSIYIDEDRNDGALVKALRLASFDVVTCAEAQMLGRLDEDHLRYAASVGRILYSANVGDFVRLHGEWVAAGREHAGIIVCNTQRWSVGGHLGRIRALAAVRTPDGMRSQLEHLSNFVRV